MLCTVTSLALVPASYPVQKDVAKFIEQSIYDLRMRVQGTAALQANVATLGRTGRAPCTGATTTQLAATDVANTLRLRRGLQNLAVLLNLG